MIIAGIDEVGRGCLAGATVSACVVLPSDFKDERIKDSKLLSKKKRELLAPYIMENAIAYSFGVVCSYVIDKVNILEAVKQSMHIAISKIDCHYDLLICDAVKLKHIKTDYINPTKADRDYVQVAAASILAKVYRDKMMERLALQYPMYKWEKNAGYGTKEHMDAIREHGITPLHRKTFLKNL